MVFALTSENRSSIAQSEKPSSSEFLRDFEAWLVANPSRLEDKDFGGIHAQVITTSATFLDLEFADPGRARGFDYWYETIAKAGTSAAAPSAPVVGDAVVSKPATDGLDPAPSVVLARCMPIYWEEKVSEPLDVLDKDGIIGALSVIDTQGSTHLGFDSLGNLFAGGVAIKNDSAAQIYMGIYGNEWKTLAAETMGEVNTVLWQHESGALHTWQLDANWQWVSSDGWWELGSAEFDAAESNFGIDANQDGIIGALSVIELPTCEIIEEKIIPSICIYWDEGIPYVQVKPLIDLPTINIFDCSNILTDFGVVLVGVTSISSADFVL